MFIGFRAQVPDARLIRIYLGPCLDAAANKLGSDLATGVESQLKKVSELISPAGRTTFDVLKAVAQPGCSSISQADTVQPFESDPSKFFGSVDY